jgi:diguanylate cyclase (GGDEF)-like protein
MSVRAIHEIAAVVLGCLSLYVGLIHLSTPALRGLRWIAIAYCSTALGILLRGESQSNLAVLLGNLLIACLGIAFYWGIAHLLENRRASPWLLLFLAPVLVSQFYFLYVDPRILPRAAIFNAVLAAEAALIAFTLLGHSPAKPVLTARVPRIGLALLFLCWTGIQLFFLSGGLAHGTPPTLAYDLRVDGRYLFVPLLPAVLICMGFLWLASAELQNELEQQSNTDSLTGLLNRRALQRAASRQIAEAHRRNAPLTLLLLDLDHFKSINDLHGHAGGDQALCLTARCLIGNLRDADLIARIGGEEFAALLPETDEPQATLAAERIRFSLESLGAELVENGVTLSASFGITRLQPHDTSLEQLLSRADQALYQAKRSGRNRVATLWG